MNDLGNLAYSIVKYEFKEDVSRFPISYISGWLEANIGELNGLLHEDFYVDVSGYIGPSGLATLEENIFKKLYTINYYNKASRDVLRGIVWSDSSVGDWISIKEADSSVQRTSKNSISRTLLDASKRETEDLEKLIYQYNIAKSSPLQVAGEDGEEYILC